MYAFSTATAYMYMHDVCYPCMPRIHIYQHIYICISAEASFGIEFIVQFFMGMLHVVLCR